MLFTEVIKPLIKNKFLGFIGLWQPLTYLRKLNGWTWIKSFNKLFFEAKITGNFYGNNLFKIKNPEVLFKIFWVFVSWRRDSNPRSIDYESIALPSELRQHVNSSLLRISCSTS